MLHALFIDEDVQHAGVAEVQQGGEQGEALRGVLVARGQHGQGRGQDGAADAKAQRVDGARAADGLRGADGLDGTVLDVVVPGFVGDAVVGVAPANHKGTVTLLHCVADERVVGLQVQDVELVDARRHEQHGPLVHLGRERLVFDQLEQLVFKHHAALAAGHVAAHLEGAGVGVRHGALLHVLDQVGHAVGDAAAFGFQRFGQGLGVQGQVVAGAGGVDPLLHAKAQAVVRFFVGLHRVGQAHQGAGVEQVHLRHKVGRGVVGPAGVAEAAVGDGFGRLLGRVAWRSALQGGVPQGHGVLQVGGLQLRQHVGGDLQVGGGGQGLPEVGQVGLRGRRLRAGVGAALGFLRGHGRLCFCPGWGR
jgi:hypothetical protein